LDLINRVFKAEIAATSSYKVFAEIIKINAEGKKKLIYTTCEKECREQADEFIKKTLGTDNITRY